MPRAIVFGSAILVAALAAAVPAVGQTPSPQSLLLRPAGDADGGYDLRAEFTGALRLVIRGRPYAIDASGRLRQWSRPGEPRNIRVTITSIRMPFLLQPFATPLGTAIEDLIATQAADPEIHAHDLFLLRTSTEESEVAGVRSDIVDETMSRYMPQLDQRLPEVRAVIARWLYTSPSMRSRIQRPGPPFVLAAVVDGRRMLRRLSLSYDWGQVDTAIAYAAIGPRVAWQNLHLDVNGDVRGVGPLVGRLAFEFDNYCLNCE